MYALQEHEHVNKVMSLSLYADLE